MKRIVIGLGVVVMLASPVLAQPVIWGGPGTRPQYGQVTPMGNDTYLVQPLPQQPQYQYQPPPPPSHSMGCIWTGRQYSGTC